MLTTVRDLGAAVRAARQEGGLSQQVLADRAGVPRQWVSRLETGSNPGAELPQGARRARRARPGRHAGAIARAQLVERGPLC